MVRVQSARSSSPTSSQLDVAPRRDCKRPASADWLAVDGGEWAAEKRALRFVALGGVTALTAVASVVIVLV